MSGWSMNPNSWIGHLCRETDKKKLELEVIHCIVSHDYGPRFWHAFLQLKGMKYKRIDVTARYYMRKSDGIYICGEDYGICYRGLDRIHVIVSISEKNNAYLNIREADRYLYLRGALELPAIYFYIDGKKVCQWDNAVENELFQMIEAAVNPKLLPLCINMNWAKVLVAKYMESV